MKSVPKIALLELNHSSRGIHTNTVPLALGMIAAYTKIALKIELDIKLFKEAELYLNCLKSWVPDIVGIGQYSWNSELNLYAAELTKNINPSCIVIAGGPNLEVSNSKRIQFLSTHRFVDICVVFDGEVPFSEVVKRTVHGESLESIKARLPAGTYTLDEDNAKLIEANGHPPRIESLDAMGSLYANGSFDTFLSAGFHPYIQTHRGCPFTCGFCYTSNRYHSKMLFLSQDVFKVDMEYLGKFFKGQHDVVLYFGNTNWSLFKEDFPLAYIIRQTQDAYDWPRNINVNSGKDTQKLLEMLSIINFQPNIALQSITPAVLQNINRRNIPFDDFVSFQRIVGQKTGYKSTTELILCLPGETRESFIEMLKKVLNSGVDDIVIYTLMNLKGTPLSSDESIFRYKFKVKHRVVPRDFSIINNQKVLDTEEVVVETSTMSYEDYLYLRGLSFTVTVFFGAEELRPLKKLLIENNINISDWVFSIHESIQKNRELNSVYTDFKNETEAELFSNREELLSFYDNKEHFELLRTGKLGDNLLRKYKTIVLFDHYRLCLSIALKNLKNLLLQNKIPNAGALIKSFDSFLSERDMKGRFIKQTETIEKEISLEFDIPAWLDCPKNESRIHDFTGMQKYKIFPVKKDKIDNIRTINKDLSLSLQVLYRTGHIRDYWPLWQKG